MIRRVAALVFAVYCLFAGSIPVQAEVVRFPKTGAPAFLVDVMSGWGTQEDKFGGLQVFPNDHASAIYLSMTRDPQYSGHPLKDVATAIADAAGIKAFIRQEPATLSGMSGEAFYAVMKNDRGVELDMKMVVVMMASDLWAVEMTMLPKNVAAAARTQNSQMIGRITVSKAP
jgi:hypothetical protein